MHVHPDMEETEVLKIIIYQIIIQIAMHSAIPHSFFQILNPSYAHVLHVTKVGLL